MKNKNLTTKMAVTNDTTSSGSSSKTYTTTMKPVKKENGTKYMIPNGIVYIKKMMEDDFFISSLSVRFNIAIITNLKFSEQCTNTKLPNNSQFKKTLMFSVRIFLG